MAMTCIGDIIYLDGMDKVKYQDVTAEYERMCVGMLWRMDWASCSIGEHHSLERSAEYSSAYRTGNCWGQALLSTEEPG